MRIIINALHMHPGKSGGAETILLELIKALRAVDKQRQYQILIWPDSEEAVKPLCSPNIGYRIVQGNLAARARRFALRCLTKPHPTAWLTDGHADVVHYTNAVIRIRPFRISAPLVLTMTDIQHVYFPEYWPREDVAFREKYFPKSVERADAVIAISEFTRRSLIEQYQCPPEKVRTIYPGVDHDRISRMLPQESWNRIKMEYKIPDRFLIYPAGTWPHKNHLRLIEAIKLQFDKGNRDIALILTGIRQFNHDRIIERIAELNLQARVLHLGHPPWDELAMLYQNAQGMIYPSLFEGFGLPIVEAMAAGCPVACSDRAAIPEIAGEAAYYFNPEDVDAISDAIERLWLDDKLRNDLIDRGRKRSRNFDWRTFAEKTIEVYEYVAR